MHPPVYLIIVHFKKWPIYSNYILLIFYTKVKYYNYWYFTIRPNLHRVHHQLTQQDNILIILVFFKALLTHIEATQVINSERKIGTRGKFNTHTMEGTGEKWVYSFSYSIVHFKNLLHNMMACIYALAQHLDFCFI